MNGKVESCILICSANYAECFDGFTKLSDHFDLMLQSGEVFMLEPIPIPMKETIPITKTTFCEKLIALYLKRRVFDLNC